jgi:hypothetical protein
MKQNPAPSLLALFLAVVFPFAACLAGDTQKVEKSPQVAAYRAYMAAAKNHDVEAWKTLVPLKQVESLKFICEMTKKTPEQHIAGFAWLAPDDLRFTSLSVNGNEATLRLTGMRKGGAKVKGEVILVLEDGAWKVASQGYDN